MLRCSLPGACWLRLAAAATLCVALAGAIGACGDAAPAPAQRPQRPAAAAQPAEPVVAEPAADQRKTERFAGVVFVHGLPKGVAPLSPLQAVRRRHLLVDSGGGDPTSSWSTTGAR